MLRTVCLGLLAALLGAGAAFAGPPPAGDAPRVTLDTGKLEGAQIDDARVFRAIPYAAPPVGPLRWRPPRPAKPWTGVRPAASDGPACLQTVDPGGRPNGGAA
jgi:para-nitrobenzyl esterase